MCQGLRENRGKGRSHATKEKIYGAAKRLTRAWNGKEEAIYQYNVLGWRVGFTETLNYDYL